MRGEAKTLVILSLVQKRQRGKKGTMCPSKYDLDTKPVEERNAKRQSGQ